MSIDLAAVEQWNEGAPRINPPRVFGAGEGSPFFFAVPATGERPLAFSAEGLPEGLSIDPATGIISGVVRSELEREIALKVRNALGKDESVLRIVTGGRLALTPPMGWNSWNVWGGKVDDGKIRDSAKVMLDKGLAAHGYSYVNIDDCWQRWPGPEARGGKHNALVPNKRFPDMKALCDYIHSLGLKAGIYSTPWVKSYSGYAGGSTGDPIREQNPTKQGRYLGMTSHCREDARQWAEWGMDYLKYDWSPWDVPETEEMAKALKECGRDIVYSLSNTAPFDKASDWARLSNCWRTTGDINDTWGSVSSIGFSQDKWTPYGGPGHWNDPDMMVVGNLGWGQVRRNRLTEDEQMTHVTLWALLAAPILLGCDMKALDDFTLALICNPEMIEINQDPLGRQGRCAIEHRETDLDGSAIRHECIYARTLSDGAVAAGLFNRGPEIAPVRVDWKTLGISGMKNVRDIWARKDMGSFDDGFQADVASHGAKFIRIGP